MLLQDQTMNNNDQLVSQAFSRQSVIFDRINTENKLTGHLRDIYRKEVDARIKPGSSILELNCGTGIDSLYFAAKGHRIMATDNADGMLAQLDIKVKEQQLEGQVETLKCSFSELEQLGERKFDYICSNFGGLNCTADLSAVLAQFRNHLNDDGKVTLVVMPRVTPWELLMAFKGDFKTAFRRFKKNTPARVEDVYFSCYYYSPSYVIRALKKDFKLLSLKGIYITVPPEFYQGFVERYPRLYKVLKKIDNRISGYFPFTYCCDHYMITLQMKKA
jgi:ubiquinone/menaquinone biosynthesis C-methylase UbiE